MPSNTPPSQVTELLRRWSDGDTAAREELMPLVYNELRRLARHFLGDRRRDHTLQCTAMVHEAYLRLVGRKEVHWESRAHFFSAAAQMMRRILVDHARWRNAAKRDANRVTVLVEDAVASPVCWDLDVLSLDLALSRLAEMDQRQSRIVELRFFGGLSIEDTSHVLDISPATVKREWATARAWLYDEISRGGR